MTRLHAVILKVREANNIQERTFEEFERMINKRLRNVFKPSTAHTAEQEAQTDQITEDPEKGTVEDSSTQTDPEQGPANPASDTVDTDLAPKIDQADKTEVEKEVCSLRQPAFSSISITVEEEEVPTTENEAQPLTIDLVSSTQTDVEQDVCSLNPPQLVQSAISSISVEEEEVPITENEAQAVTIDLEPISNPPQIRTCSLPPLMVRTSISSRASYPVYDRGDSRPEIDEPTTVPVLVPKKICSLPPIMVRPALSSDVVIPISD